MGEEGLDDGGGCGATVCWQEIVVDKALTSFG